MISDSIFLDYSRVLLDFCYRTVIVCKLKCMDDEVLRLNPNRELVRFRRALFLPID
jgi:hypothetical protein